MTLNFVINHQHIKRIDDERPVADSQNYLKAHFEFLTDEWSDISKSANFWIGDEAYTVVIDKNGNANVPWEVIKEGSFEVSCFGGDLITNDRAKVRVAKSGYKKGATPKPPTPDVYATISQQYNRIESIIDTEGTGDEYLANDGEYHKIDIEEPPITSISANGNPLPIDENKNVDITISNNYNQLVYRPINNISSSTFDVQNAMAGIYNVSATNITLRYYTTSQQLQKGAIIAITDDTYGKDCIIIEPKELVTKYSLTSSKAVAKTILLSQVNAKQSRLTAGNGITINGNTISSSINTFAINNDNISPDENGNVNIATDDTLVFDDGVLKVDESKINHPIKFIDLGNPTYVSDLEPATYIVRTKGSLRNNATIDKGYTLNIGVMFIVHSNGTATILNGTFVIKLAQDTVQADLSSRTNYYKTGADILEYNFEEKSNIASSITADIKQSTTKYPSIKAMTEYIDSAIISSTTEQFGNASTINITGKKTYTATAPITRLTITYPNNDFDCTITLTTGSTAPTNVFPSGTKYCGSKLSFKANTEYKIHINNRIVDWSEIVS